MRYECEEEGFAGCFVEFAATGWTRRDQKRIRALEENEEWFALLRSRITAVHLVTVDGDRIDEPGQIVPDALDALDLILYTWFVAAVVRALTDVNTLGNAVWRKLFPMLGATPATELPTV